jgi:hypothetical protein
MRPATATALITLSLGDLRPARTGVPRAVLILVVATAPSVDNFLRPKALRHGANVLSFLAPRNQTDGVLR